MRLVFILCVLCLFAPLVVATEPLFSGPQVGEEITPFEARLVFGENEGKEVNALEGIMTDPILLVFVHQVTRPSIGLTRLLMNFGNTKKDEGLKRSLIFLSNDPTETEAWLRRARHALPKGISPMISVDGVEGPGAYGLNRKITLTILVADQGIVVGNFPLIQPSIQVDAPKIGKAIEKSLGRDHVPTLAEMGFKERQMVNRDGDQSPEQDGIYRQMMSQVLSKAATSEQVNKAAQRVEQYAADNPWFKQRVHKASDLIVNGGKLSNYGTPRAQHYLKQWAKKLTSDILEDVIQRERKSDSKLGDESQ